MKCRELVLFCFVTIDVHVCVHVLLWTSICYHRLIFEGHRSQNARHPRVTHVNSHGDQRNPNNADRDTIMRLVHHGHVDCTARSVKIKFRGKSSRLCGFLTKVFSRWIVSQLQISVCNLTIAVCNLTIAVCNLTIAISRFNSGFHLCCFTFKIRFVSFPEFI